MASEFARYDYFVSYAHRDEQELNDVRELLNKLKQLLRAYGLTDARPFLDREVIPPNQLDFTESLLKGLKSADAFLAFLTPNYLTSLWCSDEFRTFLEELGSRQKESRNSVFILDFNNLWRGDGPQTHEAREALGALRGALPNLSDIFPFFEERPGVVPKALFQGVLTSDSERLAYDRCVDKLASYLATELLERRKVRPSAKNAALGGAVDVGQLAVWLVHSKSIVAEGAAKRLRDYLVHRGYTNTRLLLNEAAAEQAQPLGSAAFVAHILGPTREAAAHEFEKVLDSLGSDAALMRIVLGDLVSANDNDVKGAETERYVELINSKGFSQYEEYSDDIGAKVYGKLYLWSETVRQRSPKLTPTKPSVLVSFDSATDQNALDHVWSELERSGRLTPELMGESMPPLQMFDGVLHVMEKAARCRLYEKALDVQRALAGNDVAGSKVKQVGIFFDPRHTQGFLAKRTIPYEWRVPLPEPGRYPDLSEVVNSIASVLSPA